MPTTLLISPGPHGANGNVTVGTIGGILLLAVVLAIGIWTFRTWWKNNH